ncbi:hypothetical protein IU486_29740 [Streptomyces gardneri]|uniref:hypothetical protein n=1 Tax=Nocardia sputi TaxID=2943705 RepID=UPI00189420CC|nr:hypothetical protein [Nocardia sputi]MBF6168893.1 hypothetical protein [Streptomyces gardneri]UAK30893.1 hypothetical protein K8O92_23840 [Nocardia asteroides]
MTEPNDTYDPPQDTGAPDSVETDPAALNSAEDLDEDRLRSDPLEAGMDPPEHWTGVTKYGVTPWEQAHPRPIGDRLAEEEPDVEPSAVPETEDTQKLKDITADSDGVPVDHRYEEELGVSADVAGGSVADDIRRPSPPE